MKGEKGEVHPCPHRFAGSREKQPPTSVFHLETDFMIKPAFAASRRFKAASPSAMRWRSCSGPLRPAASAHSLKSTALVPSESASSRAAPMRTISCSSTKTNHSVGIGPTYTRPSSAPKVDRQNTFQGNKLNMQQSHQVSLRFRARAAPCPKADDGKNSQSLWSHTIPVRQCRAAVPQLTKTGHSTRVLFTIPCNMAYNPAHS